MGIEATTFPKTSWNAFALSIIVQRQILACSHLSKSTRGDAISVSPLRAPISARFWQFSVKLIKINHFKCKF